MKLNLVRQLMLVLNEKDVCLFENLKELSNIQTKEIFLK